MTSITTVYTDVLATSAFAEKPETMKLELSVEDILALIDKYYLLNDSSIKAIVLKNEEQYGLEWSIYEPNDFFNNDYLAPDLVNMVINKDGLTVEGGYLDDESQPCDTFKSCTISIEALREFPTSLIVSK
ncbi:hypothetical protein [Photobacterium leiognathi]|uniref:hypothetical protein n=1 Tax=Photobacterium leiognathi TaxID=553611 RepID=UPI0027382B57|nr:hypothetical protein [Photobacterium leiognathi]